MSNLQYDVMGSLKLLYAHLQTLGAILENVRFRQAVQALSKSTPSVPSSIKFQQNQPPFA